MITNPFILQLHQASYPDPRNNFPRFSLASLRDPPAGYRLFGQTADEIHLSRRFNREELGVLVKFHLYGINANLTSRATNLRVIRALVKLHYYMDHLHQAHSWEEMCDPRRDAGPRLLSCSVGSMNLIPYSRHFPVPPLTYASVAPAFTRPFYCAPSDRIPDSYVEFMLLVSNGPDCRAANTAAGEQPPPRLPPLVPPPDSAPVTSRTRSKARPIAPAPAPAPAPTLAPAPPRSQVPPPQPQALAPAPPRPQAPPSEPQAPETLPAPVPTPTAPAPAPTPALAQAPFPAPVPAPAVVLPPISELISGQQPIFQYPGVPESAPEPMKEDLMNDTNDAMDFTMDPLPEVDMPSPQPEMQSGNFVRLPAAKPHEVVEAIERAVMKFAYADLERDPSAPSKSPRPRLQAGSQEELQRCIVTSTPATATVGVTDGPGIGGMQIDPNGFSYPYRGRGPVWRGNSCAVDTVIMVGRLLDAGSTVYDRKESGWQSRLSKAEKAFVEVANANWDVLSDDDSANLRDRFWSILAEANPAIKMGGAFNSAWTVWASVASNISQFQFSYVEALCHCPCRRAKSTNATYQASFVTPPLYEQDQYGVSIEDLVARPFASVQLSECRDCHGASSQQHGLTPTVVRERRMNNVPLRMILSLDERVNVKNHTQSFSFDYCDINGRPQKATYRWLGGIYYHENHFRVFWSDGQRGEATAGEIMMYDGQQNSGLMLGGIAPHHAECRVPPVFWREGPIPLLVYERVLNPEPDVLNTALSSLSNMADMQLRNEPILHNHVPWQSAPAAYAGLNAWEPILACDNHNVHTDCNPLSSDLFTASRQEDPDVSIIDPPFPAFPTEAPQIQQQASSSPRLESAQPFTTDPRAVLHCSPVSLPISMPLRYMDQSGPRNIVNYAASVNADNTGTSDRLTNPPPAGPPGGAQARYFFVPSPPHSKKTPSPPLSSFPWDQWIKSPSSSPGKNAPKSPSPPRSQSKSSSKESRSGGSANESPSRVTKRKGKKRAEDPAYSPRRSARSTRSSAGK